MRPLALLVFALACHHAPSPSPDAGRVTPKAAAVDSAEEENEEDAAPASLSAGLRDVDGGAPKRSKAGAVLLCETHGAWTPPDGFTAARAGTGVVARKGSMLVGVQFPKHGDDSFAQAMAAFVEGSLAWDAPTMKRIDDWHAEATTYGRARALVVVTRTLYAGVDPATGKGRPGRAQTPDVDVVWLAAAPTQKDADDLLDAALAKNLMLVDHACECGYDCSRRTK